MRKLFFIIRYNVFSLVRKNEKLFKRATIVLMLLFIGLYIYFIQPLVGQNSMFAPLTDIFSIALGFFLASSLQLFRDRFKKSFEDELKVNHEYSMLQKQYGTNYDCMLGDDENHTFKYNCIFANAKGHLLVDDIIIEDELTCFEPPVFVQNNLTVLLSSHSSSNVYNAMLLRLKDICYDNEQKKIKLSTMRTRNIYSLCMNRACDYNLNGITLRELYESFHQLTSVKQSVFSNHIGIQILLTTKDGYVGLVERKTNSTVSKNGLCASFATKFNCSDEECIQLKHSKGNTCKERGLVDGAMIIEWILEKLNDKFEFHYKGNKKFKISKSNLKFLGVGQELYECGRPQVFFMCALPFTGFEASMSVKLIDAANDNYNSESDLYFVKTSDIDFDKETRITSLADLYQDGIHIRRKDFKMIEDACLANAWHIDYYLSNDEIKVG